jgi:ATP-dependent DNA helicase RecQ
MSKREIDMALDNCIYGSVKFLYLSPERLLSELVRERIKYMKVNLIAVDEAHCISQWGYDFRPPYLHIADLRELHPDVPVLALHRHGYCRSYGKISSKNCSLKNSVNVFQKSFERKHQLCGAKRREISFRKCLI